MTKRSQVRVPIRSVLISFCWAAVLIAPEVAPLQSVTNSLQQDASVSLPRLQPQVGQTGLNINSVAFSGDAGLLVSGGTDGIVKLWDARAGLQVRALARYRIAIQIVAFSPDGRKVGIGDDDGVLHICEVTANSSCRSIVGTRGPIASLTFSTDDHWLAWAVGSALYLWDCRASTSPQRLETVGLEIRAIAFSHNSRWLAFSNADGEIRVWDLTLFRRQFSTAPIGVAADSIAFNWSDQILATGTEAGAIQIWSLPAGASIASFSDRSAVVALAFRRDGALVSASVSKFTRKLDLAVWNISSQRKINSGHAPVTLSPGLVELFGRWPVAISEDGRWIAYSIEGRTIQLLAVPEFKINKTMGKIAEPIRAITADFTRKWIAAAAKNNIHLWNLQNGEERMISTTFKRSIRTLSLSPAGDRAIAVSDDNEVRQFDIANLREIGLTFPKCEFTYASQRSIACGTYDGKITLYNVTDTGISPRRYLKIDPIKTPMTPGFAISDDMSLVASAEVSGEIRVWSNADEKTICIVKSTDFRPAGDLRFDSHGTKLAWTTMGRQVRVLDIGTGKIMDLCCHDARWANAISFSPNGHLLASAGEDRTIRIWNLLVTRNTPAGQIALLAGHTDAVLSIIFSSDGSLLISGSVDGTTRIWDWVNQRELIDLAAIDAPGLSEESTGQIDRGSLSYGMDGRFDADKLDSLKSLSWIMPDDPLRIQPAEIFMRDYYEPHLLSRLIACHILEGRGSAEACKFAFKPIRSLVELNRVQPEVTIAGFHRGATADEVLVDIQVVGKEDRTQPNGKTKTAAYDLRLFRNGQLVGQWPVPEHGSAGPQDLGEWRLASAVPIPTHTFHVRLATKDRGKPVTFTAYAFNEDRVKSETVQATYTAPQDMPTRKAKAYVITVGVSGYDNPHRNLEFAVKDAEDTAFALQQIKDYEVVPISLLSEVPKAGEVVVNQATKAKIHAVLSLLAGSSGRTALTGVTNADKLAKAMPVRIPAKSISIPVRSRSVFQ